MFISALVPTYVLNGTLGNDFHDVNVFTPSYEKGKFLGFKEGK